jgi:hypothetical protein
LTPKCWEKFPSNLDLAYSSLKLYNDNPDTEIPLHMIIRQFVAQTYNLKELELDAWLLTEEYNNMAPVVPQSITVLHCGQGLWK